MKLRNPAIDKLYKYLSSKSREAYKDHLLISNVVLGKQETQGRVLETYLAGESPFRVSYFLITKKTILYFVKNLFSFCL